MEPLILMVIWITNVVTDNSGIMVKQITTRLAKITIQFRRN